VLTYSTVIPTKDRPERAAATVAGLLDQARRPERIVVVDASTPPLALPDAVVDQARRAGVEIVVTHAQPSTSRQRNLGVDLVDSPVVLFLDDDVSLEPAYADTLLRRWEAAGLGAFGGMVGSPEVVPSHSVAGRLLRRAFMLHYHDPGAEATTVRRSGKLRFAARPATEVVVPAVGAGGAMFRTDLARCHRFDERFEGYALGEDLDMSARVSAEAPIVQSPAVRFTHHWDPRERTSALRWHHRGRRETYFRLRHLGRSPLDAAAFGLSVVAEAAMAGWDSLRQRDASHVRHYLAGVAETLRERRRR
jgi:GT2 family glycosyltransferase